jgi:hypothetical protein
VTVLVTSVVTVALALALVCVLALKIKSQQRISDEIRMKKLNKEIKARGDESIDYREVIRGSRATLYRDYLDNYKAEQTLY